VIYKNTLSSCWLIFSVKQFDFESMSSHEEDEDEFLYGEEAPNAKRLKTDQVPAKPVVELKEDDDEEDDDEEESDIEIVIETKPGVKTDVAATAPAVGSTQVKADESTEEPKDAVAVVEKEKPPGLDINAVAEHGGVPITQVVLEDLEEKPWRKPGADITDYFNYGFDEFTWTAYCSKQDNLRDSFTPQKVMAMMGMPMFPPDMMGGFPSQPSFGNPQDMMPMGMFGGGGGAGYNMGHDNGAYGGSNIVQGVAGMGGNPNPNAYRRQPDSGYSSMGRGRH
jgi:pre-mRNA 3'-end-processing factor FIP1